MLALLRKAIALRPPWSLRRRLARWVAGSIVREYAWGLGVFNGLVIAGLVALGALDSALGVIALAVLSIAEVALARLAWQSLGAAEQLREALT